MNLAESLSQLRKRRARLPRKIVAVLLCAVLCGCRMGPKVYPEVQRKSLSELYCEALATAQNAPGRAGAIEMSPEMQFLPPAAANPSSNLPVLAPIPYEGESRYDSPQESLTVPPPVPRQTRNSSGWQKADRSAATVPGSVTGNIRQVSHKTAEAPLISEFLEDTDVRQALQSIATQAEVTLIIDERVGGVVSAIIEDASFESALRTILMPLGLVSRKTGEKEYLVGVADPASPLFSQLSDRLDFRPMNLSPTELVNLIPEREQKFIQVIENRNRIVIEAPPEIAQSILERLQQFDTPIPQVELEAIVCVVAPDRGFKSGLDWGHAVTLNGSQLMNIGMAGLAFTGQGSGQGISNTFSDFSVTSAFVKLLAQEGYLAIRAAPRVTARDGDQAKIAITRESFFSTQPQSDNAFFRQDIELVQAGIELDITPVVRGNNITMKIEKAEVSEDIRTSQINTGITENPYPQINRRTVSTTVHVKDGETIVIGGLVQRQTVDRIARVPVLGGIPYLGRMFQTVEQTEQDAEVVIFISPKLVHPGH